MIPEDKIVYERIYRNMSAEDRKDMYFLLFEERRYAHEKISLLGDIVSELDRES